jgi:hypothetical protein
MSNEQERYVRYSESVEIKQPDEDEDIRKVLASFARMRQNSFVKHRHAQRDAHAKSHGILKGVLTVYDDLPAELRQGLFQTPRTYPIIARYSTAPGDILPDGVAAFRGMAIKVIGVEGRKMLPEMANAVTQDFLFNNHPVFPAGDVSSYVRHAILVEKALELPEEVQRIGTTILRAGSAALRAVGIETAGGAGGQAKPETHILGETFFSMAALRYGEYIAKLSAAPVTENLKALCGKPIDTSNPSALRDSVVEFFRENSAEYEMRAQLCTDLERMPVEDASVEWSEEESPYQPIARITFTAQEAYSPERRVYADDVLTFNPWHCLNEHQPLGSIMRIRKPMYDESSEFRHRMNARTRIEPSGIEELPD